MRIIKKAKELANKVKAKATKVDIDSLTIEEKVPLFLEEQKQLAEKYKMDLVPGIQIVPRQEPKAESQTETNTLGSDYRKLKNLKSF